LNLKSFIKQSETYGMKGVARFEDLEEKFDRAEIWTLIMNGEIYEPRPGFVKCSDCSI